MPIMPKIGDEGYKEKTNKHRGSVIMFSTKSTHQVLRTKALRPSVPG